MARHLKNWLDGYLAYTENTEPMQGFHLWSGIGIIASVLQRRVYVKWAHQIIYPNLFIILVGPSGTSRKGTAVDFVHTMLQKTGITTVRGSATKERLMQRMGESLMNFMDPSTGMVKFHCSGTCIASELIVFLGENDTKFLGVLCDWFDCPSQWVNETKTAGVDKLEGVCFNILGCTAPDWIPFMFKQVAVGGGFTSRCIFVVEETKKSIPEPSVDKELESALLNDLEIIATISGEFKFTPEAKQAYIDWYTTEDKKLLNGHPPIRDPRFASYCSRRATFARKLSIIVSAAEQSSRVIELEHFQKATEYLLRVERKMPRTFQKIGANRNVEATETVLNYLIKHGQAWRSQILSIFWRDIDSWTLDVAITTLKLAKFVKEEVIDPHGQDVLYKFIGEEEQYED